MKELYFKRLVKKVKHANENDTIWKVRCLWNHFTDSQAKRMVDIIAHKPFCTIGANEVTIPSGLTFRYPMISEKGLNFYILRGIVAYLLNGITFS